MDRISLTPPELYGNIGYTNSIVERIPISIYLTGDTTTNGGLLIPNQSGSGYRADLGDVVNIDRVTDVFLDSFLKNDDSLCRQQITSLFSKYSLIFFYHGLYFFQTIVGSFFLYYFLDLLEY